jgi:Domain of unknown function (DUF4375)
MAFIGSYKDLVKRAYDSLKDEPAEIDEEERPALTPQYLEYLDKEVEEIRSTLGTTAAEIVSKWRSRDPFDVLSGLHALACYQFLHGETNNETEQIVTANYWLPLEVNNGGFHQYFHNSAGDLWPYVLITLIEGGDDVAVDRFHQVLSIFPDGRPSTSRRKRWAQMAAMEEADEAGCEAHFDRHTEVYYAEPYPKWEILWAVIERRSADIRLPWVGSRRD